MNTFKTSPMTPTKPWSKPAITVIDLRSARNGYPGQEILSMNTFKTSPMTPTKPWSKPAITVIDLRSARNGYPGVSDSGQNNHS